MSKILFTHSYFYKFDSKQWSNHQPYAPLGTIQAAAVLRREGHHVLLFDTNLKTSPQEITPILSKEKPDYLIIYDDGFNYLTKMCLTNMREAAFELIALGKQHNCRTIICSSDSTDQYEKYFEQGVDFVIKGEGEETLKALISALENNEEINHIEGLLFKINNAVVINAARPVLRTLDSLPLPAWDLVDVESYKKIWTDHHSYFSVNIATTRGCPYKCNWCAKPIYGNRYNSRSPEQVVNEIEYHLTTTQPDHFWMCDDIFGLKPHWIQEFRNIVKAKNLRFRYTIQSRVDLLLEKDTIDALAQSGAEIVWVGAESGSQKILDAMDKGTTVNQIREATHLMKSKGIKVGFFLQFGYLGETKEDIDKTLAMVLDLMPDEIGVSVSYPLPGTKFYDKVHSMLREKQNWTDSDDLAMMYDSTFSGAYYKQLHRYIHNRYRIQRGMNHLKEWTKKPVVPSATDMRRIASMVYNTPLALLNSFHLKRLSRNHALT